MRFVPASVIACLTVTTPRTTVCSRLWDGKYGPVIKRGRIPYVDLAAVEVFHGVRFTEQQISIAVDGKPERLLVIPDNQENPDASTVGNDTN